MGTNAWTMSCITHDTHWQETKSRETVEFKILLFSFINTDLFRHERGTRSAAAVPVPCAQLDAEEVCVAGVRKWDHPCRWKLSAKPHAGVSAALSLTSPATLWVHHETPLWCSRYTLAAGNLLFFLLTIYFNCTWNKLR